MSVRSALAMLLLCFPLASAHAQDATPVPRDAAAPAGDGAVAAIARPALPAQPIAPGQRVKATLIQHVAAGKQPTTSAITDGGATLIVTNRGDNTVSVFDTATMDLSKTIRDVGYSAWGVRPTSDSMLLVANWTGSSISVVDRAAGKRLGEIPVGMKPSYVAVSHDGSRVYSSGNFSGDVTIADVKKRKLLRSLEVGKRPTGVALSPDGKLLYVAACESQLVDVIDLEHEVVLRKMPAALASTTNLVLTDGGRRLLAAGSDNRLLVMDAETGASRTVAVGADPSSVAVTPDGGTAFVANYRDASVTIVDLAKLEAYASVPVGSGPIDVQTDGTRLYTCNDKAGSVSAFRLEPAGSAAGM